MLFKRRSQKIMIQQQPERPTDSLTSDFSENVNKIHSLYEDCSDVVFRSFRIGETLRAAVIYIDGLVNVQELEASVLSLLLKEMKETPLNVSNWMKEKLSIAKVTEVKTVDECIGFISIGYTVLLLENENIGFALGLAQWEKRSIEPPESETIVKGPREGFTESVGVNLSLIRRKIKSPQLKTKSMKIGRSSQTEVVITYIRGVADETLIEEVQNRLRRIDIDAILESQYIEELIEDMPYSPFPQIYNTERPDICAANLLEGRVVILVDGSPSALILPITLFSFLQANEDYYQRYMISTAIRWLRYLFLFFSIFLPSLYVAVLSYHQEMVPTKLIITMASSRENVPFPAVVEALIMEITFEALREAGIRLPKQVGAAVSIVGALVIGQAAIQAGIVSPPMVMVVALTGIASFTIPQYNFGATLRLLRFPMMFLAGTLGLLGIILGVLVILTHLCKLRSFGVPYLTPLAPLNVKELKDVLVRAPIWKLSTRPHLTGEYNKHRQSANLTQLKEERSMIEKGKISAVQIAMLLYTSIVVTGILFLPIITYLFAERDFWMAPILSMLLGFILVSVMCKLQRYYPKETIIQYCGSILGKGIGKIVSLLILLNLLYQSYMSFNAYALFVNDYYLPDTPKTVIMGSIAAACAFAVRGGVETIGRLAQLITPLLMILFMVLFLFLLTEIDLRNMFPILGNGVLPLLKATYFSNIWFSEFIYIGFLLPFLDNHQGGKKWVMLCCMSTMVSIVMISMVILLILGETLEGFTVPFATAVQFINIGEFFTHLESLVMAFWIMGAFIKMILLFYMLTLGWAQWYNLSDYRPFVIPAIFLVTLLAIWQIKNGPAYHLNIITIAPAAAHLSSLFPILLLLIAYFKKKKQKKTPRVQ